MTWTGWRCSSRWSKRRAFARPVLEDFRAAVAAVGELGAEPRCTLRLHVAGAAESFLSGPLLAGFLAAHPHVRLDLVLSDAPLDIVAGGYDADIQLGEVIDRDMIAVPVSGDLRLVVVGAPEYFTRHPKPLRPRDLAAHACINWHPSPEAPPYRWEFTEAGRDLSVAVPTRVLTTDPAPNLRLAKAGAGLSLASEDRVRDDVTRGALVDYLRRAARPSRAERQDVRLGRLVFAPCTDRRSLRRARPVP